MKERVIKNRDSCHIITIQGSYGGNFTLVDGARPYLSVHTNNIGPKGFGVLSGSKSLRRLAYAILRNVKAKKKP